MNSKSSPDMAFEDAIELARREITRLGLDRDPRVAMALQTGRAETPLLVERIDDVGRRYLLMPWVVNEGVVFVVQVDVQRRLMLGLSTLPMATPSPFLQPDTALAKVRELHPDGESSLPRLVWMPCRQSTSPYRPFYQIAIGDSVYFIDMDGVVFLELIPLGRGG